MCRRHFQDVDKKFKPFLHEFERQSLKRPPNRPKKGSSGANSRSRASCRNLSGHFEARRREYRGDRDCFPDVAFCTLIPAQLLSRPSSPRQRRHISSGSPTGHSNAQCAIPGAKALSRLVLYQALINRPQDTLSS